MRVPYALLGASAIWSAATVVSAQTGPVLYQLSGESTYQSGCFGPCACPEGPVLPITGTFVLTQVPGPLSFDLYNLTDIRWVVKMDGTTVHLTGSGTCRIRTQGGPTQQLDLDLKDDSGKEDHYTSGEVAGGKEFPAINITVSISGALCFNTFIHVVAAPVKTAATYRLHKGSTWSRGCFGICDCILRGPFPMTGSFTLAFQEADPLFTTYAIENVNWTVSGDFQVHEIKGSGTYTVGGEVAVTQRLLLDLQTDGEPVEHFDSGIVPGGAGFPTIDIDININGLVCFDTLIHVRAKPLGDFNVDGSVDATDLEKFLACVTGPARAWLDPRCDAADLDDDGDVDQVDFGLLQRCLTGPGMPVDPACAD